MADTAPTPPADVLTQEEFSALLGRLHGDQNQAALKYEALHFKLRKFFQWSSCSSAEELADETLNRTARKLYAGAEHILDVEAFAWGIAKRIRQEGRKKDARTVGLSQVPDNKISDAGASLDTILRRIQVEQELQCLRSCLRRLPEEDQEIFLDYRVDKVHHLEKRKQLAERFGLTSGALRVRVIRLREKLEKCVMRCLKSCNRLPAIRGIVSDENRWGR